MARYSVKHRDKFTGEAVATHVELMQAVTSTHSWWSMSSLVTSQFPVQLDSEAERGRGFSGTYDVGVHQSQSDRVSEL